MAEENSSDKSKGQASKPFFNLKGKELSNLMSRVFRGSVSTAEGIFGNVSKNTLTFAFLVAAAVHYYKYLTNFQLTLTSIILSLLVCVLFALSGFNVLPLLLPFLLETFIPLSGFSYGILSVQFLLLWPWQLFYVAIASLFLGATTKTVNIIMLVGLVAAILVFVPSLRTALYTTNYVDQTWIIEKIAPLRGAANDLSKLIEVEKCALYSGKSREECAQELQLQQEALKNIQVATVEQTEFKLSFDTLTEPTLNRPEKTASIKVKNGLKTPVTINFACGLEGKNPGISDPETTQVAQSTLTYESRLPLNCKNLDISKRGLVNFYYNASATGLYSTGLKYFFIVSKTEKENVLKITKGASENEALLNSVQFGKTLALAKSLNLFTPVVGKEDLIQPIVQEGDYSFAAKDKTLLHGIANNEKIPLAIFIKNNGKGRITNVKDITITLPDDFAFEEGKPNCGLTSDFLKNFAWKQIQSVTVTDGTNVQQIQTCNIVPKPSQVYPSIPQQKTIKIKVDYDYVVTAKQQVTIPSNLSLAAS